MQYLESTVENLLTFLTKLVRGLPTMNINRLKLLAIPIIILGVLNLQDIVDILSGIQQDVTLSPAALEYVQRTTGGAPKAPPNFGGPYAAQIRSAAQQNMLDPRLLEALIFEESMFDPNAQNPSGAAGLTQLMPPTAESVGVSNPYDPQQSINGGAKYLSNLMMMFGDDPRKALAGYNAGPGNVQKYNGVPPFPETQAYVNNVAGRAGY